MDIIPTEHQEGVLFADYCVLKRIPFHHSPNEGKRSISEGRRLKRVGLSKGFPDYFIPLPNQIFHGLFIELKRVKKSTTSPEQLYWIKFLQEKGYAAYIAKGAASAIEILDKYLSM